MVYRGRDNGKTIKRSEGTGEDAVCNMIGKTCGNTNLKALRLQFWHNVAFVFGCKQWFAQIVCRLRTA